MSSFCKIYCAGSVKAPYEWITNVPVGINRIIYINGGDGGYEFNGIKTPFKKDCLYIMPSATHYINTYTSYQTDNSRLDHSYVNFELIPPLTTKQVLCLDDFDDQEIKSAVETFKTFCKQCSAKGDYIDLSKSSQEFLKSTVLYLVEVVAEKYHCEFITDKVIIEALKQMHENIGQKFSISDLAKTFFLSADGFIRRFKRILGETPYSYMKNLKIRTAQNMRQTGANLQEIAEKCGYADASSLLHAITPKTK